MKKEMAKAIVEACEQSGVEGVELRDGYIARGMFPNTTCGVVAPSMAAILMAVIASADLFVAREDVYPYPLFDDLHGLSEDNMGLGVIVY